MTASEISKRTGIGSGTASTMLAAVCYGAKRPRKLPLSV
jgi:hypothetical protein